MKTSARNKNRKAILRDVRENQLPKWDEITERNGHGAVMQETAEYFANKCAEYDMEYERLAFYEIAEIAKTINRLHDERGCLYGTVALIRSEAWKQLNHPIKVDFGEEVYFAVIYSSN